jgi:hypothetical protein
MTIKEMIFEFLKELSDFSYETDSLDRVWQILFPDKDGAWHHVRVTHYRDAFYMIPIDGRCGVLEVKPRKQIGLMNSSGTFSCEDDTWVEAWEPLIVAARQWLRVVCKDWVKANKRVWAEYPLKHRYGVVPHALVRESLPEFFRLDSEVGGANTRRMVRLVEEGFFRKNEQIEVPALTAAKYFRYCKIAYIAGKRRDEAAVDASLSGRELYRQYADGRHEGLLDIDPESEQEFADWIDRKHPKRGGGGHPWEIKRGGNTTHIDLSVTRPYPGQTGFRVELRGESFTRLAETIRMFLAIQKEGLPISLAEPEGVRRRLLAQDNIGIVPAYASLHRANQRFCKEDGVYDVMHYDDFGRAKRRIIPFVTWEPLPIIAHG